MHFKLSIISLGILSLVSGSVIAETGTNHAHHHLKHTHHHLKHVSQQLEPPLINPYHYKDGPPVCIISQKTMTLEAMTQNSGRAMPTPCNPYWFDRIQFSGGITIDAGKFGDRTVGNPPVVGSKGQGYLGENTSRVSVNDAYLNMKATVNDWTSAFVSLSYIYASNFYSPAYQATPNNLILDSNNGQVNVQQAFMRFMNPDETPVFVELGQEFQDYGRYELHPITESMTQSLTETLRTSLKVGYLSNFGLNGSVAIFQDPIAKHGSSTKNYNYIGAIGYQWPSDSFGINIGGAYLYNFFGVNAVGNTESFSGGVQFPSAVYNKRVSSVATYLDVNVNPVIVAFRYTTTTDYLSPLDLEASSANPTEGAKPWAASVEADYGFVGWCRDQSVYLGYQISRQTVNLNLPRDRYMVGYTIEVIKNATLAAEWDHDLAYSVAQGGSPQGNTNLFSLRAAFTFA